MNSLTESEPILVDTLLQQPKTMVSTEEALSYMENRAEKGKQPKLKALSSYPVVSLSRKGEKQKHTELS